jgi:hypothetical protein
MYRTSVISLVGLATLTLVTLAGAVALRVYSLSCSLGGRRSSW